MWEQLQPSELLLLGNEGTSCIRVCGASSCMLPHDSTLIFHRSCDKKLLFSFADGKRGWQLEIKSDNEST